MFKYTSILKSDYRRELEQLLFFNTAQHSVHFAIMDSINIFGEPVIDNDGERLRINLKKLDDAQTLFAFNGDILVGIMVYSRISQERIVVIHIAVHEDYSSQGKFANQKLVLRMSQHLRKCARSIKGIKYIRIMYGNDLSKDYTIRKHSPKKPSQSSSRPEPTIYA